MAKKLWYHYINDATRFLRCGNADELINKVSRLPNTQVIRNARNTSFGLSIEAIQRFEFRKGATRVEVLEEFVHSQQFQYYLLRGGTVRDFFSSGPIGAAIEIEAKQFLLRHRKILQLGKIDQFILKRQINRLRKYGTTLFGY